VDVGLKTMTNDELRNAFLNAYIPKAKKYGLEIPDTPRIRENDDGTYEVEEDDLDWDEFFTIAKNDAPGSHEQIGKRNRTQEAVEWVRNSMDGWESKNAGKTPQAAD
jgi:ring-1,2-phenylacetyl-CoA epoxidase subunit PaaA